MKISGDFAARALDPFVWDLSIQLRSRPFRSLKECQRRGRPRRDEIKFNFNFAPRAEVWFLSKIKVNCSFATRAAVWFFFGRSNSTSISPRATRFLASSFSQRAKRNQKRWTGSNFCCGFRRAWPAFGTQAMAGLIPAAGYSGFLNRWRSRGRTDPPWFWQHHSSGGIPAKEAPLHWSMTSCSDRIRLAAAVLNRQQDASPAPRTWTESATASRLLEKALLGTFQATVKSTSPESGRSPRGETAFDFFLGLSAAGSDSTAVHDLEGQTFKFKSVSSGRVPGRNRH